MPGHVDARCCLRLRLNYLRCGRDCGGCRDCGESVSRLRFVDSTVNPTNYWNISLDPGAAEVQGRERDVLVELA